MCRASCGTTKGVPVVLQEVIPEAGKAKPFLDVTELFHGSLGVSLAP